MLERYVAFAYRQVGQLPGTAPEPLQHRGPEFFVSQERRALAETQGQSDYTPQKEEILSSILAQHLHICRGIFAKHRDWLRGVYYFYDIYAGSGINERAGCDGSPLVFLKEAERLYVPYVATFIDKEPLHAEALARRVARFGRGTTVVYEADNAMRLPLLIAAIGKAQPYGIIYADPNGMPPFELLAEVSQCPQCRVLDILIHCSATTLKRFRGAFGGKNLMEHLGAIQKSDWLIRDPEGTGKQQWTFLFGTNWPDYPEYKRIKLHNIKGREGKAILAGLTYTQAELNGLLQPKLPASGLLSYSTYEEYRDLPEFKAIRAQVFARARGVCERCGQRPPTEAHHITYPAWGTLDVPENMIAVCHECHCEIHGKES